MRRFALLAACLSLAACTEPPHPGPSPSATSAPSAAPSGSAWPDELPRTPDACAALLRARTLRPIAGIADADLTADALLTRASAHAFATVIAGEDRITRWIQAFLDRAREEGAKGRAPGLDIRVVRAGAGRSRFLFAGRTITVGEAEQHESAPAADTAYALEAGGIVFAGALRVPPGGELELTFDPKRRSLSAIERPAP